MENMEIKQAAWEELSIANDFLFGKTMLNPDLCRELLQIILPDLKSDRIEYPELQKAIKPDMDARSVRLDVYVEDKSISQGDGTAKIFLNANGTQNDVSKELKAFLDYVSGKKSEDSFVEKLEEAVKEAKKNREWRHEYMTLLMRDRENEKKGIEKGIYALISALKDINILDDIILQKVQEKFHLSEEEASEYMQETQEIMQW